MKNTNRNLISDIESNNILTRLSDRVDLIEKVYNPDRLNLHFNNLPSWDVALFKELLSIGMQAWKIIKNYKSWETAYWFYDFFLLLSRASLSVLNDKTQYLISKEVIERLVILLVDLFQITTVEEHFGDITKRNYEALGNIILAFGIMGDLQKLALNRANEINVPEVIKFTRYTIKKVKEIKLLSQPTLHLKDMPSQISWLDFSEKERKKMIEVVQLFREQDTRDELGVASIRDIFAELLFPGTGTLQTRARYFLIIPWHFLRIEKRHLSGNKARDRLRREEINVINTLKEQGEERVIGQVSGASLHRFPSSIYWNGLRTWGILRFSGSPGQYFQSLNYYYERQRAYRLRDKDSPILETSPYNWDPEIPPIPDDFPGEMGLSLSFEEATYLKERLQISCPRSLLAYLVRETEPVEGIDLPWHHPDSPNFPNYLRQVLLEAQNFSETFWGAALLYNFLLSEKAGMEDKMEEYQGKLSQWREMMQARWALLQQWDIEAFWQRLTQAGKIPSSTQKFVNDWLHLALDQSQVPDLVNNSTAHELIRTREFQLKRGRSRFENPRRLEMWGGSSGAGQLNYRWPVANQITNDILNGLDKGE